MSNIEVFKEINPSLEQYWRSIILYGSNVASYKFALGKSLLDIAQFETNEISLSDLATHFSRYICEHLMKAPRQTTSNASTFIDACKDFNNGSIELEQLHDLTVKHGFNYVLDKFPIVNGEIIPIQFYEYNKKNKKLIINDNLFKLKELKYFGNLTNEVEARWNLVETAWEMGISTNLLQIKNDADENILYIESKTRRKNITSARDALNGYQKGVCFYCFDNITLNAKDDELCDVDHFFPHTLQNSTPQTNLNGIWNLVLSCKECNRGENGKFAKIPTLKYLERLNKRNEYLISSHHPLRETLIRQTGKTQVQRHEFLQSMYDFYKLSLVSSWEAKAKKEDLF